jgi:RNA 2',3'-cyclic 3'-phosphodiesterase
MRAFVAVPAPPELCDRLLEPASPSPGVRWLPPENLHLTALFLGEVAEQAVPALIQELETACLSHRRFELRLERIGPAPPRRPRMIWGWFGADARLSALAESLAGAAAGHAPAAGPPRTDHPHVTLARLGRGKPPADLPEGPASGELPVHACTLMRSTLSPSGAAYTELARLPLA